MNTRASRYSRPAGVWAAAALAAVLSAACAGPPDVSAPPKNQSAAVAERSGRAGDEASATAVGEPSGEAGDEASAAAVGQRPGDRASASADDAGSASAGDAGSSSAGNAGSASAGNAGSASAGNAESASAGKPVAPFSVRYELLGAPAVGQRLEVRITVRPSIPMTDLELEAAGDASLDVDASDAKQTAPSATREAPAEWSVSVVPRDVGTLRLKITVDGVIDGNRQARSLVVPIRLQGEPAVKPEASTQGGPKPDDAEARGQAEEDGEALIHLHSDR